MVGIGVCRCRLRFRLSLNEVQCSGIRGVDDVVAERGIEGSAPHPGSAPMIGKLQSSVGRRRRIGTFVGYTATLQELRVPLAAGGLVTGVSVAKSFSVKVSRDNGGGLRGKGWVGEYHSPGTSPAGTGRSSAP